MKNKTRVLIKMTFVFLSAPYQAFGFDYSSIGLNIAGDTVTVDNKSWSTKSEGSVVRYDTLPDVKIGGSKTVWVKRSKDDKIESLTERINNVFPKSPANDRWEAKTISTAGVISCKKATSKTEDLNHCIVITAPQCNEIRKVMSEMTLAEINKCSDLTAAAFKNHSNSAEFASLKSALTKNLPDMKGLPIRQRGSVTLWNVQELCQTYYVTNPKALESAMTNDSSVKSDDKSQVGAK